MTKLPRLFVKDKFTRLVNPISVGITENVVPLSTATISLPKGEELPMRSYVELFTPYGSAGMFRVRSPHNAYGDGYASADLEHMIAEVGDYIVKAEISTMMAANAAVKKVFSYYSGSHWKLGSYSAIGTDKIALDVNYGGVLDTLLGILEQKPDCMMKFDFSTTPWTVSIVKKGISVVCEGRLSRNITSATVSYDDSQLATRVWYQTFAKNSKGETEGKWTYKDANVSKYGVVEATVSTSSDMTVEEINAVVNQYLRDHKAPKTSVSIQAVDLSRITGERMDKFFIGDLYRLAIPQDGITVELNITSRSWRDVYGAPDALQIQLGDEPDTVVTFLHNLDSSGKGRKGGGGGQKAKEEEKNWKEYTTYFDKQDRYISAIATRQDKQGKILEQAGMKLTSKEILTYVSDKKTNIMSRINEQADRISLIVEGTGKGAKIKRAAIIATINKKGESEVTIEADYINLTGYVKANTFNGLKGDFQTLITGRATAYTLNVASIVSSRITASSSLSLSTAGQLYLWGTRMSLYTVTDKNGNDRHVVGY